MFRDDTAMLMELDRIERRTGARRIVRPATPESPRPEAGPGRRDPSTMGLVRAGGGPDDLSKLGLLPVARRPDGLAPFGLLATWLRRRRPGA